MAMLEADVRVDAKMRTEFNDAYTRMFELGT